MTGMHEWPITNHDRNCPVDVRFEDSHAMIDMVDGRAIGVPLFWFPAIQNATPTQRDNFHCYRWSVYWRDLDDGIDMTAMLTGLYIVPPFKRAFRAKPYEPISWQYMDDGIPRKSGEETGVPFVEGTRNIPVRSRFSQDSIAIDLADGRILSVPSRFFPDLEYASDTQRRNYFVDGLKLRWDALDKTIDLIALLTGYYEVETRIAEPELAPALTAPT